MAEGVVRNPLKERLAAGQAITITVVTMASPAATQVWARSGIDCLILDMEHGAIGIESVHAMVAATAGTPATPIVRVPWNVPWLVKPVLDTGAMGICFPMIADADDAAAAVRAVRYPPAGERGWGPFYAHMRWGQPMPRYVETASDELFTMLLIERPEAIRNLDAIARVPGIDMLVVAPFDLTVTMGHGANREHPEVQAAIRTAEERILASGVPLGGAAFTPAAANQLIERGYRGVFFGFDWLIMQRAAAGLIEGVRLGR
jgi:4-hydroxy-2-oxoheptanedioate aldolase